MTGNVNVLQPLPLIEVHTHCYLNPAMNTVMCAGRRPNVLTFVDSSSSGPDDTGRCAFDASEECSCHIRTTGQCPRLTDNALKSLATTLDRMTHVGRSQPAAASVRH